MNDEDIVAKLAEHSNRIKVSENRIADLEELIKNQNDLVISVNRLAYNMEGMLKELEEQGKRLKKLENEPIERWNNAKKTAFTSVVSTLSGGAVGLVIAFIVWYIRSGGL